MAEVIPLLHNISSVQRLLDFARLTIALGYEKLVVTRAYGAAAQHGLGELGRIAYKAGVSLIVLPDISDAIELLQPDEVLIVSRDHAREYIDLSSTVVSEGRVLAAFNGGDPDFSPQEAALGRPIYFKGLRARLGPAGEAALLLYLLAVRGEGDGG